MVATLPASNIYKLPNVVPVDPNAVRADLDRSGAHGRYYRIPGTITNVITALDGPGSP